MKVGTAAVVDLEDFKQAVACVNAWTELYDSMTKDLESQNVRFSNQTAILVVEVGKKIKALKARHDAVIRERVHGVMDA